ncbi:unnamed protein product [Rodentolepis nana]|uniref:Uncharacterized protein n=1 Tax=Rodentolepis nana TaxID=102285 RepID=A0A0R3T1C1_RODNA|nr:unnamed protein product [Rodentolepis nana]
MRESSSAVVKSTQDALNQLEHMRDSHPALKLSEPTVPKSALDPCNDGGHYRSIPEPEKIINLVESHFSVHGSSLKDDTDLAMKRKPFKVSLLYFTLF